MQKINLLEMTIEIKHQIHVNSAKIFVIMFKIFLLMYLITHVNTIQIDNI